MRKWTMGVLLSVALLDGIAAAEEPKKQSAVLVEFHYLPKCAGLDCPPWHTPPDIDFCFQVGDAFYTGESRSWGVPWASSAEGLTAFKGKSVDIVVTDKSIRVTTPSLNFQLRRFHDGPFQSAGCAKA
jgi:hypothetical protein